jgi:hypothetical protein
MMTEEIAALLEDAKKIESGLAQLGYASDALKTDIKSAKEMAGKLVKALDYARISAKQEASWGADNRD